MSNTNINKKQLWKIYMATKEKIKIEFLYFANYVEKA